MTYLQRLALALALSLSLSSTPQVINTPNPGGLWQNVTFAAGNFTGSTGAWTLQSGDQVKYRYMVIGKTMFVSFDLVTTTVINAGDQLRITIPNGAVIAANVGPDYNSIRFIDNGGAASTAGMVQATTGATFLTLFTAGAGTGFAAAADTTAVRGEIFFEIQ